MARTASVGTRVIAAGTGGYSGVAASLVRFCRRKPLGAIGGLLICLMVLLALGAQIVAPYDPIAMNYATPLTAPGVTYPFGTDNFGRDVLSRVIFGARISLYVALLSVGLGTSAGAILGVLSGYIGGRFDMIVQRSLVDVIMAFPTLVLALGMVSVLGPSVGNVVLAIGTVQMPRSARIVRSAAISVREREYIEAARAVGAGPLRVVFLHVVPNCVAPYIVYATGALGAAVIVEASLSFLGVGTPPPTPSWGGMLAGAGREYMEVAPWMAIYPGVALSLAVFGFNLLGDSLRDVLDPRLR
ncbi:MAG: ABC transporter permease [Dehalococcoidia bacterium]|nr:ABC transporter permease [Dehalococcoidia bacterium]